MTLIADKMNFIDTWILNGITFDCGLHQDTAFNDLMDEYDRMVSKIIVCIMVYGVIQAIRNKGVIPSENK